VFDLQLDAFFFRIKLSDRVELCWRRGKTMSTRDLGKHVVELHTQGMLVITGEGARVTLAAHEALDLLHWLNEHREILREAIRNTPVISEVPDWMREAATQPLNRTEEQEIAVDEP
jgi:hypothetical protein